MEESNGFLNEFFLDFKQVFGFLDMLQPDQDKPAHTVAIDLESNQAEIHCQKCGTFETPARKLRLFRR